MRIHNTMTGKKEEFVPVTPGQVQMYVCGITVYDHCHIGHARSAIVFDVMRSYLKYKGFTRRIGGGAVPHRGAGGDHESDRRRQEGLGRATAGAEPCGRHVREMNHVGRR